MEVLTTIVRNKIGGDMMRMSGLPGYPFDIPDDSFIVIPSRNEYGILARYSEILFQKGKTIYKEAAGESNVVTKTILPGPVKCIVRTDWVEPKRPFPVVHFLNEGGAPMEIYYTDCFNMNEKLYLPLGIPVMTTVPVYSPLAKFRELIIHKEETIPSMTGTDLFVNHEMKGKRSEQELERLARMLNDWKESERNRIKVM